MDDLLFGPAGVPHSSARKDTISGILATRDLGLDCMEVEFVYGVRMKENLAREAREVARNAGIVLTAHAPYYINLNAKDPKKLERSIKMLCDTVKIANLLGAWSVVFHPGWYMGKGKKEAYRTVKESILKVLEFMRESGIMLWLRPETMELEKKFGSVEEVIQLSEELENVLPCIDFAHIRYRYHQKSESFFRSILEKIEERLGKEALKNMHIHLSGIKLDSRGTHINLKESDMPWESILKILKEFNVKGVVISESPNLEEDAIMMKEYWKKLK